jgi:hypothetical protein
LREIDTEPLRLGPDRRRRLDATLAAAPAAAGNRGLLDDLAAALHATDHGTRIVARRFIIRRRALAARFFCRCRVGRRVEIDQGSPGLDDVTGLRMQPCDDAGIGRRHLHHRLRGLHG